MSIDHTPARTKHETWSNINNQPIYLVGSPHAHLENQLSQPVRVGDLPARALRLGTGDKCEGGLQAGGSHVTWPPKDSWAPGRGSEARGRGRSVRADE